MSWNITGRIVDQPAPTAREMLDATTDVPQPIKDYMAAGIIGLVALHGDDVRVTITGYGHLCDGESYEITSATLEVRKSQAPPAAA